MGELALVAAQARYALLTAARNPRVIVFSVAMPIILLVLFNSIFTQGSASTVDFAGGKLDADAYFTAGIAAYAIALSSFTTLVVNVTTQRESGQLKRLRGTPMPAWTFLAAQIVRSLVLVLLMVVVLFAIGAIAFGVEAPGGRLVGLVTYVALGTATLAALGIALTAFTPTADAAASVGPFSIVLLSFVSGVFIPVDTLPNWLEDVGRVFPLYHLADGLQTCMVSGGGTGLEAGNVAVLALWGGAGIAIAARRFRWEPQAARG